MVAVTIELDGEAQAYVDELVRDGRFTSREEAVRAGVSFMREQLEDEIELTPEIMAAIEEGLADARAGRVRPAEEVFDELLERYRQWK